MARRYAFHTTWRLAAPPAAVAAVVRDFARWPEWWPGMEAVTMLGEGRVRQAWRSPLAYRVTFVATVERASDAEIEGSVDGMLAGRGSATIRAAGPAATEVSFDLHVELRSRWMRALAPLARPAFAWAHRALMRRGGEGIARKLGARPAHERAVA